MTNAISQIPLANIILLPIPGKSLSQSELLLDTVLLRATSSTVKELTASKGVTYKIVIINDAIQRQRARTKHTALLQTTEQLRTWKIDEEKVFQEQADRIRRTGANIVIATGIVHDIVLHYLQEFGIVCIANYSNMERLQILCKASGCTMVHQLDDLTSKHAGMVQSVEIVQLAQQSYTKIVSLPKNDCCTVTLHGSTMEQCEEYVRHCQDALQTVNSMDKRNNHKFIPGGGAFELQAMVSLKQYVKQVTDQEKHGVLAFAEAFEIIPKTLCENAALNVDKTIDELLEKHKQGGIQFGIPSCHYTNDNAEEIDFDMIKVNVFDSYLTKQSVLRTATSIACMILQSKFVKQY
jgi:T-complex protein 1 subunit theta